MPAGSAIEMKSVGYRAGARRVLGGLDVHVSAGETLVLLGASGSGKTTALRLVNALLFPTEGQVLVEGRATTEWDPIQLRRRVGYVIQEAGLFPHFSVEKNVGIVPSLQGWTAERIRARVAELLRLVGLSMQEHGLRFPHELSGGQRQRVGVARALAADPPLLLLDEPFGALDPLTRATLQREFKALMARLAKTAIFVTHDVREALLLGTRIALLDGGHLIALGTPAEFRASREPLVRAWIDAFADPGQPESTP